MKGKRLGIALLCGAMMVAAVSGISLMKFSSSESAIKEKTATAERLIKTFPYEFTYDAKGTGDGHVDGHGGWTVLTTGGTLPGGNYYLEEDITITSTLSFSGDTNLCLNGHSIRMYGAYNTIEVSAHTLNIHDCIGQGRITHMIQSAGGLCVNGGTCYFNGGQISGNNKNGPEGGGGVYVKNGDFFMRGGAICSNVVTVSSFGAGVCVNDGAGFYMYNGAIYGNKTRTNGGGVYVAKSGTFEMCGGYIVNNSVSLEGSYTGSRNGGGVFVAEGANFIIARNPKIFDNVSASSSGDFITLSNVYLSKNTQIKFHASWGLTAGARISVGLGLGYNDSNFTSGFSKLNADMRPSDVFYSDIASTHSEGQPTAYPIVKTRSGEGYIANVTLEEVSVEVTCPNMSLWDRTYLFQDVASAAALAAAISASLPGTPQVTMTLLKTCTADHPLKIGAGNVLLSLGEYNVIANGAIGCVVDISGGAKVFINGKTDDTTTGCIDGNKAVRGIYIHDGSSVELNANIKNCYAERGGGIYVTGPGSKAVMGSGTIDSCFSTGRGTQYGGGGVGVYSGASFEMTGGTIIRSEGYTGGGVYVDGEGTTFTMSGKSVIKACRADWIEGFGGGVAVYAGGVFKMSASGRWYGEKNAEIYAGIDGCDAPVGGGVYVSTATFEFSNGMIHNCVATTSEAYIGGGGIAVYWGGHLKMTGGEISNNTASNSDGGGIFAVSNEKRSTVEITRGDISSNTASSYGGGIRLNNADVTLNGSITFNKNTVGGTEKVDNDIFVGTGCNVYATDQLFPAYPIVISNSGGSLIDMNKPIVSCKNLSHEQVSRALAFFRAADPKYGTYSPDDQNIWMTDSGNVQVEADGSVTSYGTFLDAFTAAKGKTATIKLLRDTAEVNMTARSVNGVSFTPLALEEGDNFTIDLAGHRLTKGPGRGYLLILVSSYHITIKSSGGPGSIIGTDDSSLLSIGSDGRVTICGQVQIGGTTKNEGSVYLGNTTSRICFDDADPLPETAHISIAPNPSKTIVTEGLSRLSWGSDLAKVRKVFPNFSSRNQECFALMEGELYVGPHSFSETGGTWTWMEDLSSATVTATCLNNCGGEGTATVKPTTKILKKETCTQDGTTEYTVKATLSGTEFTDSKTQTVAATGHNWTYTRNSPNKTITAQCQNKGHTTADDGDKSVTFTFTAPEGCVYGDGNDHAVQFESTSTDGKSGLSASIVYTSIANDGTAYAAGELDHAGEVSASITLQYGESGSSAINISYPIGKATAAVTVTLAGALTSFEFGEPNIPALTVNYGGLRNGDDDSVVTKAVYKTAYDPTDPANRGIGKYGFTQEGEDTAANYEFTHEYRIGESVKSGLAELQFEVIPLPIGVTWDYLSSYTYTGAGLKMPEASAEGLFGDAFKLAVDISEHPGTAKEFLRAGSYTFTATFDLSAENAVAAENYSLITGTEKGDTLKLSVGKATVTPPEIGSKDYENKTLTADVAESLLYDITKNDGGVDVGKYDVVLTLTDADNYTWTTSDQAAITLTFEITIADNKWNTAPRVADRTYGETISYPVAEALFGSIEDIEFAYATSEDGPFDMKEMPINAGTYWVQATVKETKNYHELVGIAKFVIGKATATVTLTLAEDSIVYGATDVPALTVEYSGFVNGDTDSVVTKASYSTAYDPKVPAHRGIGTYDFTQAGEDTADNYEFTYVYLLVDKDVGSFAGLQFTVTAKPSVVTWGNTSFIYTGDACLPEASIEAAYLEDDVTLTVTPAVATAGAGSLTEGKAVNVGRYTATATLADPNYDLENETTPFEIGKLTIEVSWSYLDSYTYTRGALTRPTASANGVKDDTFELAVEITEHPVWGKDKEFICAGDYVFTASFDPSAANAEAAENYSLKSGTERGDTLELSVAKMSVTVEWTVGSYIYTGVEHIWPSATADDGHVKFEIAMTEHSPLGEPDEFITAGGYVFEASFNAADDHNYEFHSDAVLSVSVTIEQAKVGVAWRDGYENSATYADRDFNEGNAVTRGENFVFTGLVEADRTDFDAFTTAVEGDVIKDAGEYSILVTLTDGNYVFEAGGECFSGLTFTVYQAKVDEHWGGASLPREQVFIYHEYEREHDHALTFDADRGDFPLSLQGDDKLQNQDITYLYATCEIGNIAELIRAANAEHSDVGLLGLGDLAAGAWTAKGEIPDASSPGVYTVIFRAVDPNHNHETLYGYFTVTIHKEKLTLVLDERIDRAEVVYGQVDHSQANLRRDILPHIASIVVESADGSVREETSADGRPWLEVFKDEIEAFNFYFRTSDDRTEGTRFDAASGVYLPVGPLYYLHIEYLYGGAADEEQNFITFAWTHENVSARPSFEVIPATLTYVLDPPSAAYFGGTHNAVTAVFQGLVGEESLEKDVDYALTFALAEGSKGELQDGLPLNAGDYIVTLRLLSNEKTNNYVIKVGADTQEYTVTADKILVSGIKVSVKAGGVTYGDTIELDCSDVRFFDESGREITKEFLEERGLEISVTASGCFSKYNMGDRPVVLITKIDLFGDTNDFELRLLGQQAFAIAEQEIERAALTVHVHADGSVSYDGFVDGDDESVLGGELVVENGQASGLMSGNYNISYIVDSAPAAAAETNYVWLYAVLGALAALCVVAGTAVLLRKKHRA